MKILLDLIISYHRKFGIMKYKFIDIGCGPFDVSSDIYGTNVKGMFVEPISEFLNVLPCSDTIDKVNVAISNFDGESDMDVWMLDKPIKYYTKNQLISLKNAVEKKGIDYDPLKFIIYQGGGTFIKNRESIPYTPLKVKIKCITLQSLVNEYNIESVDHLKIDVEGHENIILYQLLNIMQTTKFKVNNILQFEWNDLSDRNELYFLAESISKEFGFEITHKKEYWNEDLILIKK